MNSQNDVTEGQEVGGAWLFMPSEQETLELRTECKIAMLFEVRFWAEGTARCRS